ncbi:DoxX family protein [Glutamicibacter protophormiae]|uniref:DoxX family protein n=1 Tax=Glutamicibacter protophormiae TaxID=37930 RepID=UPI003A9090D0
MDVDLGLLLLRVVLTALLWGHATQKLFGWFHGQGAQATARSFEHWGLRPGLGFVILSGTSELIGGALIVLGLLIPVGVMIVVGTMIVAIAYNLSHGLWAHRGGYEVALVYALLAIVIGVTGPGAFSADAAWGLTWLHGPLWTLGAALLGLAGAMGPITIRNITVRHAASSTDAAA